MKGADARRLSRVRTGGEYDVVDEAFKPVSGVTGVDSNFRVQRG
jgi:hypothetical protein